MTLPSRERQHSGREKQECRHEGTDRRGVRGKVTQGTRGQKGLRMVRSDYGSPWCPAKEGDLPDLSWEMLEGEKTLPPYQRRE